jgi:hypothetical protein
MPLNTAGGLHRLTAPYPLVDLREDGNAVAGWQTNRRRRGSESTPVITRRRCGPPSRTGCRTSSKTPGETPPSGNWLTISVGSAGDRANRSVKANARIDVIKRNAQRIPGSTIVIFSAYTPLAPYGSGMGGILTKYALLPKSLITQDKTLILAVAAFIVLALSACAGSNVLATPTPVVTRTVTVSPSAKPSVKATHNAALAHKPSAARAAAPALLVVPANYGGPAYSGIEPQYVQFSGDAGNVVTAISWSSWTATKATGTGTMDIQGCVPDCATGSETPTPAYLVLSDPVNGKFTTIAEYIDGRNETPMWPEVVEQADPPGAPFPARAAPTAASLASANSPAAGALSCTTIAGYYAGGLAGHLNSSGFCVADGENGNT